MDFYKTLQYTVLSKIKSKQLLNSEWIYSIWISHFFLHKIYYENTGQYEVIQKRLQTKLQVKKDLDISTLYSLKYKYYHSSRGCHGHDVW